MTYAIHRAAPIVRGPPLLDVTMQPPQMMSMAETTGPPVARIGTNGIYELNRRTELFFGDRVILRLPLRYANEFGEPLANASRYGHNARVRQGAHLQQHLTFLCATADAIYAACTWKSGKFVGPLHPWAPLGYAVRGNLLIPKPPNLPTNKIICKHISNFIYRVVGRIWNILELAHRALDT